MKRSLLVTLARGTARVTAAVVLLSLPGVYTLVKYRPRSSKDRDFHEKLRGADRQPTGLLEKALLDVGRTVTTAVVHGILKGVLTTAHDVEVLDADKLYPLLLGNRGGVPLLTFANHISTLDDPLLMAAMTPSLGVGLSPGARRMRWGICTEEICFPSPGVGSFFAAGKALPIQRGGSMHQKAMATLQRKVNDGDWVHVFPEGRCWQEGCTPLRDAWGRWCTESGRCSSPWSRVGPFKWGVGKLIANASTPPLIVPYFHYGMHELMPMLEDNENYTEFPLLTPRRRITVAVGDPVVVDDLLQQYHAAARVRALERNVEREKSLRAVLATDAARESARLGRKRGGWEGWFGGGGAGAVRRRRPARPLPPPACLRNRVRAAQQQPAPPLHPGGRVERPHRRLCPCRRARLLPHPHQHGRLCVGPQRRVGARRGAGGARPPFPPRKRRGVCPRRHRRR